MAFEFIRPSGQPAWLARRLEPFLATFFALPVAERWFRAMFWTFGFYLVFFSSGFGFREVLPPISFICLCGYWRHNWQGSALYAFAHKWALLVFAIFLVESVAFSHDPLASFLHVGRGLNKQFLVFFLAMECARGKREVIDLAWCLLAGCFFQSMVCLWQLHTGFDPIQHYPLKAGRLTGSMGSFWVGNYIVLAGIPAFCLWGHLARKTGRLTAFFIFLAIVSPLIVATYFSSTRAAVLALLVASSLAWARRGHNKRIDTHKKMDQGDCINVWELRHIFFCLCLAAIILLFLLFIFGEGRLSLNRIFHDPRLTLWGLAVDIFKTDIWTGIGPWQYKPTVQSMVALGTLTEEAFNQTHPHNAWLQVLCETGIIGFVLCFVPMLSLVWQCLRVLWPAMHSGQRRQYAWAGFCFLLGVTAFFAHWLIGHDFFRPWYQALFLLHLGVASGVATRLRQGGLVPGRQ